MMGMFGGMSIGWSVSIIILWLAFWIGVVLLTIWFANYVRETKQKQLLIIGLILTLAALIISSLWMGSGFGMMGIMGNTKAGQNWMRQMMQDSDFRQEMERMMHQ